MPRPGNAEPGHNESGRADAEALPAGGCGAHLRGALPVLGDWHSLEKVKHLPGSRRDRAHLVTEAQRPMSQDIAHRERRYLIMMGIRIGCFLLAIALFVNGAGWLTVIPAIGAVAIPYFAVVFANGGREPSKQRGLSESQVTIPASRLEALEARRQARLIVGYVTHGENHESGPAGYEQREATRAARETANPDG